MPLGATSRPERLGVVARRRRVAHPRRAVGRPTKALERAARRRGGRPTGGVTVAPSARAKARSARRRAVRLGMVDRRAGGARRVPRRRRARLDRRARPGPAAGTKSSQDSARRLAAAAQPLEARRREHDRVALALARACAAACRRCRAAPPPRGPRARDAAAPCGAATTCRRAPLARARPARRRRRARRAGRRARGREAMTSPSASSPGTSLAECTARSISPCSSARSSSATQRDLSPPGAPRSPAVTISTSSPPPSASATSRACASASALPRVPMRSVTGAGAGAAPAPRRTCRRPPARSAAAGSASPSSPNSSRASCRRAWVRPSPVCFIRSVGSCSSRLMTARATASTRARSRVDSASHRPRSRPARARRCRPRAGAAPPPWAAPRASPASRRSAGSPPR